MAQTAEECIEFLEKAREAVDDLAVSQDREHLLQQDENKLGRLLETETKLVTDTIQSTIKKRREELCTSYDTEIGKAQDELKQARSEREKAKNQKIKGRIEEETSELHLYNQELEARMKTSFKKNHVPVFCRTRLYYSLYFPRAAKEFLVVLLFVAVMFLAIPYGIYLLIPDRTLLWLAGIYLADILVFGGLYMTIGNNTKLQYMEPLKEGRQILDQINANNKKIRVITSTIRKDRNESLYDLEKYDDEIARLQQELSDVAAQKKDALNTFESVTKTILQDEIEHNHKEKLEKLQADYANVKEQLRATSAEVKEKRLYITNNYASLLGQEFLNPFKINDLCMIIKDGRASNVSEAIAVYRNK